MSERKFPKSVSFNTKNENDRAILEYVKRRNFSGYVKKLILADMKNNDFNFDAVKTPPKPHPTSKLDELRRQLASSKYINDNPDNCSRNQTE